MKSSLSLKFMGATLAVAGLAVAGITFSSPRGRADDQGDPSDSRIEQGFEIAPVHLNLEGKNRELVGLGSYIVNTEGCDDCHSAGPPTQYARGGNPFFGQPKKRHEISSSTQIRWSKSSPVLKICRNSAKVRSPSGSPVLRVGVKFLEIMCAEHGIGGVALTHRPLF